MSSVSGVNNGESQVSELALHFSEEEGVGYKMIINVDLELGLHAPGALGELIIKLGKQFIDLQDQYPDWTDVRDSSPLGNGTNKPTLSGQIIHNDKPLAEFIIAQARMEGDSFVPADEDKVSATFTNEGGGNARLSRKEGYHPHVKETYAKPS